MCRPHRSRCSRSVSPGPVSLKGMRSCSELQAGSCPRPGGEEGAVGERCSELQQRQPPLPDMAPGVQVPGLPAATWPVPLTQTSPKPPYKCAHCTHVRCITHTHSPSLSCTYTLIPTHSYHAQPHSHSHACTHTHSHASSYTHSHALSAAHTLHSPHSLSHSLSHTLARLLTLTLTHIPHSRACPGSLPGCPALRVSPPHLFQVSPLHAPSG